MVSLADDRDSRVANLIEELHGSDWVQRQSAARVLGEQGKNAAGALAELRRTLREDSDYDVREAALRAIVTIEPDQAAALPDIAQALGDSYPQVRSAAAELVGQLDEVPDEAAEMVWTAIGQEYDPSIRATLATSLQAQVPDLAGEAMRRLRSDDEAEVAAALAALTSSTPVALDPEALVTAALSALQALTRRSPSRR